MPVKNIYSLAIIFKTKRLNRPIKEILASETGNRLVHGAFWSFAGALVSRILAFISVVVVARTLGKEGYGQFAIIQSTVGMFGVFAGFGLSQTATRYIAELRDKDIFRAGRIMGLANIVALFTGLSMAIVLFYAAPWLAKNAFANSQLTLLLKIGSIILFFEAMNGAQLGALAGFEAYRSSAMISFWSGIVALPSMLIGVLAGGLVGSVWGLLVTRCFAWLLCHIAIRREIKKTNIIVSYYGLKSESSILLRFSLPAMLGGVLVSPTLWICNALLVNQPHGYEQMGVFNAAASFKQVLLFLGNTLGAPLLPILTRTKDQSNGGVARINILSSWILGVIPAIMFSSIPQIAIAIYGREYSSCEFTGSFLLIVFSSCLVIYRQGLTRAVTAYGLVWWDALSGIVWSATMILCTMTLIHWGALGYAMAFACAHLINAILFIPFYARKRIVPKGTLVSLDAGLIWMVVICGIVFGINDLAIWLRVIYVCLAIPLTLWLFRRMWRSE